MASQQVVEHSYCEFRILVLGDKRSAHRCDLDLTIVLFDARYHTNLTQPATNADDLSTMVEERPLVLHFVWNEEHTVSQAAVDGEPQRTSSPLMQRAYFQAGKRRMFGLLDAAASLSLRERLELFRHLCSAVEHAQALLAFPLPTSRMTLERSCRAELAEFVPDHVFRDKYFVEQPAVVNFKRVSNEFRDNRATTIPCPDRQIAATVLGQHDLAEQLLINVLAKGGSTRNRRKGSNRRILRRRKSKRYGQLAIPKR